MQSRMTIIRKYNFNTARHLGYLHNGFMATRTLVRRAYVTCTYVEYPRNCLKTIMITAERTCFNALTRKHIIDLFVWILLNVDGIFIKYKLKI